MNSGTSTVLTVNGGSSSIKFALFGGASFKAIAKGKIQGIGLAQGHFAIKGDQPHNNLSRDVNVPDYRSAVSLLKDWVEKCVASTDLIGIGHRVVHGGPKYWKPERVTSEMIEELKKLTPFDPGHLPEEVLLIETFHRQFPDLPQVACFDTAFHHDMPKVARLLPIPRRYEEKGVRRYGFHGLSCAFLLEELERQAGTEAAKGRVILAHLGSGSSITAVRDGQCIDTSMGLTPAAGLPMSCRSGDLDPGLPWYLSQTENLDAKDFHKMVNSESGLLGISETSSDMQELLAKKSTDFRAAEAVDLFCYQAKKWIGAYAAALGGLDTLIFAGGIGENAAPVRTRICEGLSFLGIKLDASRNEAHAKVISQDSSPVTVRVIPTDEEVIIAKSVFELLENVSTE